MSATRRNKAAPTSRDSPRPPAYVGLMSGTSLDGITAVVVRFHPRGAGFEPELLAFNVCEYSPAQRSALECAMLQGTAQDYCRLQADLGEWLADAAVQVIAESGVPRTELRAVASHGQTIWHEPPHSTWQIGESAVIAERTGLDVVSDFRMRDVAAGGQGAPLVPMADALLFAGPRWRALQNIGGIGNVTVLPPNGALESVRAFDTGPGVMVIDAVVRALFPGQRFDRDGARARAGTPIESVVEALLRDPYFAEEPPKSTGRERFGGGYAEKLMARCQEANPSVSPEDLVATATLLTARSIADAYRRFMPEPVEEILVSGGGAKNPALFDLLTRALHPVAVRPFHELGLDDEAREAVAFALLGHLFLEQRPGNVPSVTGARAPRILGKLTHGNI